MKHAYYLIGLLGLTFGLDAFTSSQNVAKAAATGNESLIDCRGVRGPSRSGFGGRDPKCWRMTPYLLNEPLCDKFWSSVRSNPFTQFRAETASGELSASMFYLRQDYQDILTIEAADGKGFSYTIQSTMHEPWVDMFGLETYSEKCGQLKEGPARDAEQARVDQQHDDPDSPVWALLTGFLKYVDTQCGTPKLPGS